MRSEWLDESVAAVWATETRILFVFGTLAADHLETKDDAREEHLAPISETVVYARENTL